MSYKNLVYIIVCIFLCKFPLHSQERYYYVPTGNITKTGTYQLQGYTHFFSLGTNKSGQKVNGGTFTLLEGMYGLTENTEVGFFSWINNGTFAQYGLNVQHKFKVKNDIDVSVLCSFSRGAYFGTTIHILPTVKLKNIIKKLDANAGILYGSKSYGATYIYFIFGGEYTLENKDYKYKGEIITGNNWNSGVYSGLSYSISNDYKISGSICLINFAGYRNLANLQVQYMPK